MKEAYFHAKEIEKKASDAIKQLADAVNSMSYEQAAILGAVEGFMNTHPTLRAAIMRSFVAICTEVSVNKRVSEDGRFKAATPLCNLVAEWGKENTIPFI
jgi:hypothetical protein